tara:strand:+ start:484 stop:732 length:249 start_codon:yes stop_codon:yes gene_type:complete
MKKIYLIMVLVLASYGFSSDVEVTSKSVGQAKANIVSVCVFPSDTAKKGYLFLYVRQNGFQQVMESNSGNIPRVAKCERKTK